MIDPVESAEPSSPGESGASASGETGVQACLNCRSKAIEHFCAKCGQRTGGIRISLRVFVAESFSSLFRVDSRLWQSLGALVRRPGLLTLHYLQGHRVRYIGPLRLYLSVSFLTFLLMAVGQRGNVIDFSFNEPDSSAADVAAQGLADQDSAAVAGVLSALGVADSSAAGGLAFESGDGPVRAGNSTAEESNYPDNWIGRLIERVEEDPRRLREQFSRRFPWVFFFVMPVFASTLQLLYRRRESYYVPHLIFTLHFYTAGFLFFAIGLLAEVAFGFGEGVPIAFLAASVYLFFALRRVYSESRSRTIVKLMTLATVHTFTVTVGVLLLLAYALLTF